MDPSYWLITTFMLVIFKILHFIAKLISYLTSLSLTLSLTLSLSLRNLHKYIYSLCILFDLSTYTICRLVLVSIISLTLSRSAFSSRLFRFEYLFHRFDRYIIIRIMNISIYLRLCRLSYNIKT